MKTLLLLTFIALTSCSFYTNNIENKTEISGTFINSEIEITFAEGNITGFSNCNEFGGEYEYINDTIIVSNFRHTKMSCENDFNFIVFNEKLKAELNNNVLELKYKDFSVILLKE